MLPSSGERTTRGSRGSSASERLRDDLRRRCIGRARHQRRELVQQHREKLPIAPQAFCRSIIAAELKGEEDALSEEQYVALMLSLEEELRVDYDVERSRADAMFDDYERYEEQRFADLATSSFSAPGPLCPLCGVGELFVDVEGVVRCSSATAVPPACELALDARGHPAPLELLRQRMCSLIETHAAQCRGEPHCRIPRGPDESAALLLFTCDSCGLCAKVV